MNDDSFSVVMYANFQASQIERDSFQTLDEVEMLAENTSAALSYLLLQCAGKYLDSYIF